METTFYSLASKNNFNMALRHFFTVNEVVDDIESKKNLADVINELLDEDEIVVDQILPIVGAIIRDKFNYSYDSYGIPHSIDDFKLIAEETLKWTALDIIIVYYDPTGKVVLINPKNIDHFEKVRELSGDQLLVVYAKFLKEENKKVEEEAIMAIEEMIAGKDVFINKEFIDQTVSAPAPAAKAKPKADSSRKKNVTSMYGVQVSNELFHNGNVEAWKKIIESYHTKFPGCQVHVFFDNEIINDLNSLFKWGKVNHADTIFFQVAGENVQGVSKLKKYLFEGASKRYEQFLKIGVGQVLNLF
ncbi:MAG: hypothetical protein GY754_42085 [bacterium]|nr:hypothetical protein [bacterium]